MYLQFTIEMFSMALPQDELGLNREIMLRLSSEKKWQLYLSKQKVQRFSDTVSLPNVCKQPCHWVNLLRGNVNHPMVHLHTNLAYQWIASGWEQSTTAHFLECLYAFELLPSMQPVCLLARRGGCTVNWLIASCNWSYSHWFSPSSYPFQDQQTSLRTDHPQPEFYVDEFVHLNSVS